MKYNCLLFVKLQFDIHISLNRIYKYFRYFNAAIGINI